MVILITGISSGFGKVMAERFSYKCIVSTPLQRLSVIAKTILPSRVFTWIIRLYYKV